MSTAKPTDHSRVHRMPERGHYDRETIYRIVDEALICHVAFVDEGRPFVIPTLHARRGDEIYLHGAPASRLLKIAASGAPICLAMTLVDGIVVARSNFNSSINYRSAVIFGTGRAITDPAEKIDVLHAFSEHLIPGRSADSRANTEKEYAGTAAVAVTIDAASAKMRSGGPKDGEADGALPFWAGVLPVSEHYGVPVGDPLAPPPKPAPDYLRNYTRKRR